MSTFKIGDKVRCIDDTLANNKEFRLFKRRSYRITKISSLSGVWIKGNDVREDVNYSNHRFEKVLPNRR